MKPKVLLTIVLLLIGILFGTSATIAAQNNAAKEVITIYPSSENHNLALQWQSEYEAHYSNNQVFLEDTSLSAISKLVIEGDGLAILSENDLTSEITDSFWRIAIGRNILVPVMANNSSLNNEFEGNTISSQKLIGLINSKNKSAIHFYYVSNSANSATLQNWVGQNLTSTNLIALPTSEALLEKLLQDNKAIGFCNLSALTDENNQWLKGLIPVTFDFNQDGKLDKVENIYESPSDLSRGAWIGKYPKGLVQSTYLVAGTNQLNQKQMDFIRWALTLGQSAVGDVGMTALVQSEIPGKLSKIEPLIVLPKAPTSKFPVSPYLIVLAGIIVLAFLVFELMVRRSKKSKGALIIVDNAQGAFTEDSVKVPGGMLFDCGHTWAFREKDGTIRVGLDDFLQKLAGPLTRILMKDEETVITKGEPLFTLVQDGKQLVVVAPVSGTIKTINTDLISAASIINQSPYDLGWIYIIEPLNWSREATFLRVAETYKEWLNKEFARLKDFFAQKGNTTNLNPSVVMQDGGEIIQNALSQMGPEVWEDFQTNFLDQSN